MFCGARRKLWPEFVNNTGGFGLETGVKLTCFLWRKKRVFTAACRVIIAYIISAILQLHLGHTLSTGPLTLSQDMCKKSAIELC